MPLSLVACGTLDAVIAEQPFVLLDVFTPFCKPCQQLLPALEEVARIHAGRVDVRKLDASECADEAERLGVTTVPTLVLFRDGEEIDRRVGGASRQALEAWVRGNLEG
jgi:thioredoxin-like negative regulator of GroEL